MRRNQLTLQCQQVLIAFLRKARGQRAFHRYTRKKFISNERQIERNLEFGCEENGQQDIACRFVMLLNYFLALVWIDRYPFNENATHLCLGVIAARSKK